MPMTRPCDNCGRPFPVYRLEAVLLDARVQELCPRCVSTERERLSIPWAPRADQGAIQPSTQRDVW